MLIFSTLDFLIEPRSVYTLTGFREMYPRLDVLNPATFMYFNKDTSPEQFSYECFRLWETVPEARAAILDIVMELYNGINVMILIDESFAISSLLVESLSEYIYLKFGHISNIVHDIDDIITMSEGTFSMEGLSYIDEEINRTGALYGKLQQDDFFSV